MNPTEGIWTGSLPLAPSAVLAVLENGETWSYYSGPNAYGVMQGTTTASGTSFSSDLTDYDLLADKRFSVQLTGTATPRTTWDSTAANGARIVLSYSARYDQPASAADLAGTWQLDPRAGEAVFKGPLTIDASGAFTITDLGCTVAGSAIPRPSGKNVFNLRLLLSGTGCFLGNGSVANGVALLDTSASPPTVALMAIVPGGPQDGFFAFGTKGTLPPPPPPPTTAPAPSAGSGSGGTPAPTPAPTAAPTPAPTAAPTPAPTPPPTTAPAPPPTTAPAPPPTTAPAPPPTTAPAPPPTTAPAPPPTTAPAPPPTTAPAPPPTTAPAPPPTTAPAPPPTTAPAPPPTTAPAPPPTIAPAPPPTTAPAPAPTAGGAG